MSKDLKETREGAMQRWDRPGILRDLKEASLARVEWVGEEKKTRR